MSVNALLQLSMDFSLIFFEKIYPTVKTTNSAFQPFTVSPLEYRQYYLSFILLF